MSNVKRLLRFDKSKLQVIINKNNLARFILFFIIIWVLLERFLMQLGAPSFIIYLIDVLNMFLFVATIKQNRWKKFCAIILAYLSMIVCGTVVAVFNYGTWEGSLLFTAIEIRNVIRFPVFFLSCVVFLNENLIEKIFKLLTVFFYVNSVYILYQYITFHPAGVWMRGDLLNGFFGTTTGGNTFVNAIMLCVVSFWFCRWSEHKCKLITLLIPLSVSVAIAGLIELKVFFVEIAILYFLYFVGRKKSFKDLAKNVLLIVIVVIVGYVALQYMYSEYPWFRETMSLSGMFLSLTEGGYSNSEDLNRLSAIFTVATRFFNGDILNILFGIGLGNGAIYSLGGAYTKFCRLYETTHYSWFLDAYVFIQCGLFGLAMYVFSFIDLLVKKKNKKYGFVSKMMILLALVLMIYNETLKTDAAYFIYFTIACGFVKDCPGEDLKNIIFRDNMIKQSR